MPVKCVAPIVKQNPLNPVTRIRRTNPSSPRNDRKVPLRSELFFQNNVLVIFRERLKLPKYEAMVPRGGLPLP